MIQDSYWLWLSEIGNGESGHRFCMRVFCPHAPSCRSPISQFLQGVIRLTRLHANQTRFAFCEKDIFAESRGAEGLDETRLAPTRSWHDVHACIVNLAIAIAKQARRGSAE